MSAKYREYIYDSDGNYKFNTALCFGYNTKAAKFRNKYVDAMDSIIRMNSLKQRQLLDNIFEYNEQEFNDKYDKLILEARIICRILSGIYQVTGRKRTYFVDENFDKYYGDSRYPFFQFNYYTFD